MSLTRRQFSRGMAAVPLAGIVRNHLQTSASIEPPTLLWEIFSLLPSHGPDGDPLRLTTVSGEMIFPGTLRATNGITPESVRPIMEADTGHLIDLNPVTQDEGLTRLCGVGLDGIDAIATFKPFTLFIGDFSTEGVHAAWEDLGYAPGVDPDVWSWKGLSDEEMDAEADEALLAMQRRLALPQESRGHYRFLTCIGDRVIVEAESGAMLQLIGELHASGGAGSILESLGSVPTTIGHVAKLYEDNQFVGVRRPESSTERMNLLQETNEEALRSIEDELGRMPRVDTALLSITPGTPWRKPLDATVLPDIASTSLAHIRLEDDGEAERYLAIAHARFETLSSAYTETPLEELFTFEGRTAGNQVTIELDYQRTPRYDILQMSYFDDLAFLTWEPDDKDTWRSAR